jgi:hypothetical protein
MPFKRQPTPDEIDGLADAFRPLWRDGDVVRPWLRRYATRLRALIADGWSWEGLAAVLTQAGITYRTKRPWTANALKVEVCRATAPLKPHRLAVEETVVQSLPPEIDRDMRQPLEDLTTAGPRTTSSPNTGPAKAKLHGGTDGSTTVATAIASDGGAPRMTAPKFRAFTLKPYQPPAKLTPEEVAERAALERRFFARS